MIGDGRCVFDIVMKGTAPHETTTGQEIARAASELLNECVRDQRGQAGVASNIGMPCKARVVSTHYALDDI